VELSLFTLTKVYLPPTFMVEENNNGHFQDDVIFLKKRKKDYGQTW